jgi:hypothetical protein
VIGCRRALPDPFGLSSANSKVNYGPYPGNRIFIGLSAFFAAASTLNPPHFASLRERAGADTRVARG